MRLVRPLAPAFLVLTLAACTPAFASPSAGPLATAPAAKPTPVASAVAPATGAASAPAASAAATRIEVTLSDALKIEPATMTVPAGVPVTFIVHNTGAAAHEFTLGDAAEQAAHEQEMTGMSSMAKDEENAIGVPGGATKELTFTFDKPGDQFAACHVAGHYMSGMNATITITP